MHQREPKEAERNSTAFMQPNAQAKGKSQKREKIKGVVSESIERG